MRSFPSAQLHQQEVAFDRLDEALLAVSSNNVLEGCHALALGGVRAARPAALTLFLLPGLGAGLALSYAH